MVSKAIDEGLLRRIQKYVANDINSRTPPEEVKIKSEDVFVLSFSRVLNNWKAFATTDLVDAGHYDLVHDGLSGVTIANVYRKHSVQQAII